MNSFKIVVYTFFTRFGLVLDADSHWIALLQEIFEIVELRFDHECGGLRIVNVVGYFHVLSGIIWFS